ncbi:uncharacterized protein MEPE_02472 [Melanopsichium pennsylvanicum]|uniref:Nucleolar 27S pre-rRNA processing Urb2/Npa2 C-terminal domain-containing protein n=2 Tax=Melanopsichium pennsylvanicum TaxID=63383 RepID=A0AAJ4XJZ9_9BASI|nr:putative protein [Melanopsichium pennsylvanicum 4]SNX83764.1 uncharacterized protein MEPE_02472 [Melanopsichium pennsylvanicum]
MPTATRSQAAAAGPSTSYNAVTSALAIASITTSEQLVKTLRIPLPPADGISKVDIASEAWHSASFFVPKKAELLSQWTLEYLCSSLRASPLASAPGTPSKGKNKSKQQQKVLFETPTEIDLKAWQLLSTIITAQVGPDSELTETAKRSWVSHLANTQPILNLAGSFANQLQQAFSFSLQKREALMSSASISLARLLPPATSRTAATNIEAATDAIQAWLSFFTSERSTVEQQTGYTILHSMVSTWTTSLQYGTNAKRNYQHFCNIAISSLLDALCALGTSDDEHSTLVTLQLKELVEMIAAESLFTEDVQRALLQAARSAEITRTPSWKHSKVTTSIAVVQQLTALLQDPLRHSAALCSLPILSDLLCTKLRRGEALNAVASSSSTLSGSVRETQLALVRKTMLAEWFFPLLPYILGSHSARDKRASVRKGILRSIEQHNLYIISCDEAEEWRSFLTSLFSTTRNELRQVITTTTITNFREVTRETADHLKSLASLWRLEKSVIEEDLVSIFALVAVQPVDKTALSRGEELYSSTKAGMEFFRAAAAIYARLRTIPSLVNNVLSSVKVAHESCARKDEMGLILFTSQTFMAEFGKLCRDSVTATQVPDLLSRLQGLVHNLDSISTATSATPKAKRQRTASKPDSSLGGANALTAQLQIAAQVVQSVNLAPTLRARSIVAAEELHNNLILPCLDPALSSTHTPSSPSTYGVAAAALRMRQALLSEKWRYDSSEPVKLNGSLPSESLPCLESDFDERADSFLELLSQPNPDPSLCQLQFQILQAFLQRAERDASLDITTSRYCLLISQDSGPLFEFFENLLYTETSNASAWSGSPYLVNNSNELKQVIWMAIVTRWASLFEILAGEKTLKMLAAKLVATSGTNRIYQTELHYITSTALRNAAFLELPKWRKHILETVRDKCSNGDTLEHRLAATAPLWITPIEWVNRSARASLAARLLMLDRDIVKAQSVKVSVKDWVELRSLLSRILEEYVNEAESKDDHLFASISDLLIPIYSSAESDRKHAWEKASLAAMQAIVRVLVQRSKANPAIRARIAQVAKHNRSEAAARTIRRDGITLKMRAAQDMFGMLGEVAQVDVADSAKASLEAVKSLLSTQLESTRDVAQALDVALYHLREIHLCTNAFGTADAVHKVPLAALSKEVVAELCLVFARGSAVADREGIEGKKITRPAAEVALELVKCIAMSGTQSSKAAALAACLAYSALLASMPALQEQKRLADGLQKIIAHLDSEVYDIVLSQLLSALRTTTAASAPVDAKESKALDGDAAALISTIGLALGSAPEGTSKIARTHLSSIFAHLTTPNLLGVRSAVAAVTALDALCSNHVMLFRTQDVAFTLQLLTTITGPSMSDTPTPSVVDMQPSQRDEARDKLFHGVVSTLGSLMRLRQDLVLGFLPHLGSLLARLCVLFRQLRRACEGGVEASGMQRRALRRDLPSWLDPVYVTPLDASHHARALSRLLSSLVVKNVSLKHRTSSQSTSTETGSAKAESLARPFSKHATYILVAYLRILTVPNSVVTADVRAELEVGMMTICEVMGTRQRDAAMIGMLDAAGKVLFKRLWGVFEEQRYKGQ